MCREEKGSPSVEGPGWDWEECLRIGRGNATLIGDIGEGTWGTLAEGGGHGSRRADEGIKEKCWWHCDEPRWPGKLALDSGTPLAKPTFVVRLAVHAYHSFPYLMGYSGPLHPLVLASHFHSHTHTPTALLDPSPLPCHPRLLLYFYLILIPSCCCGIPQSRADMRDSSMQAPTQLVPIVIVI